MKMTFEEYREAVIKKCKDDYSDFCKKWEKELQEAIEDFDERKVFESAYKTNESISGQAYCLMMCI